MIENPLKFVNISSY